ncbi:alanine racemase [Corynebacterium yudongzhengii]|uniref:Alanine racemase n=1 Tax=Corynebacterium yudongzhengii TaxID=2080740 RepID=A0A2U1T6X0_9CORY|nr:alanine racemase [Corynebacterium yudongzhengii]AWB81301.1 alanine racemase [Corynebacterium yudongzhengii]PWC01744.1 alanine racemase [Corynebacterium yudongzhengii]
MSQLRTRIDLAAIAHNTRAVAAHIGEDVRLMAVVKADGYNHGAVEVARVMAAHGAQAVGVATIAEALSLRTAGIDAPVLAWLWDATDTALVAEALKNGIELGVPSLKHLRVLAEQDRPARICLKVETGMHRSGIDRHAWREAFMLAGSAKHLEVTGLFTHFACADDPESAATDEQLAEFRDAIAQAHALGLNVPINHAANSPATLSRRDTHFDQVRVGLALYGLNPLRSEPGIELRPALSWEAEVTVVKPLQPGDAVSYGHTFTADRAGYTAVIPAGYADGVPRAAQGQLEVTIGGRRYAQIGRVCMDQIVVDLGDTPHGVAAGDTAVIMGVGGMSLDELAERLHTINYEIACLPKGRTVRQYVNG